jgi:hypothetical protein
MMGISVVLIHLSSTNLCCKASSHSPHVPSCVSLRLLYATINSDFVALQIGVYEPSVQLSSTLIAWQRQPQQQDYLLQPAQQNERQQACRACVAHDLGSTRISTTTT